MNQFYTPNTGKLLGVLTVSTETTERTFPLHYDVTRSMYCFYVFHKFKKNLTLFVIKQ